MLLITARLSENKLKNRYVLQKITILAKKW